MVGFLVSLGITGAMLGLCAYVATRRPVGTPVTWGEALIAATFLFALMLMAYGVVPDQFLRLADGELRWRRDVFGIPTGPLPFKDHTLFADGISFFGRGRIMIPKETIRDAIAAGFYVVFGLMQIAGWLMWQRRGRKVTTPELETSAFGRPLVRQV